MTVRPRTVPAALLAVLLAGCTAEPTSSAPASMAGPAPSSSRSTVSGSSAADLAAPATLIVDTVATGLDVPWGLGFLPDGTAVLTERETAKVKTVVADGAVTEAGAVDGVVPAGEGGLLGLAVSPTFTDDDTVFVYYTAADDNRVAALTLTGGRISGQRVILTGLPKNSSHNGGRLAFGPDGNLYVGTGDAQNRPSAQDTGYLGGKILRITVDGSAAAGNPFPDAPLVYSLGHRNVQGLAFDSRGRLWASEFGQNTWDELNLIRPGGNYGWPMVEGASDQAGFVSPQRVWATSEASPSGIAILGGSVWMAALRGERLWQIPLVGDGTAQPVAHLTNEYGRLRTAVVAPDGSLWVTTSNTDGRGDQREGDDRILRVVLG